MISVMVFYDLCDSEQDLSKSGQEFSDCSDSPSHVYDPGEDSRDC